MKYFKKLVGERVYLSPLNKEDAEIYTKWMNDRSVTDGLHLTVNVYSTSDEEKFIEGTNKREDVRDFAIVSLENDELLGNCNICKINYIDRTATLGIFIGEEENRNKGYGKEVLNLLLDYGFRILNLHNIDLKVFSFNERAIACYKSIGFKEYGRRHACYFLDGKYHDEIFMEMLEGDYRR